MSPGHPRCAISAQVAFFDHTGGACGSTSAIYLRRLGDGQTHRTKTRGCEANRRVMASHRAPDWDPRHHGSTVGRPISTQACAT